jgi:uncharacterized protein YdiU (UPF0061 family)
MRHPVAHGPFDGLRLDSSFVDALPADPLEIPEPRSVAKVIYSFCMPTAVAAPEILAWSADVAALLGLEGHPEDFQAYADVFAGNRLLPGSKPYATCYGGHQFGQWAGQLGDGRALMLGTVIGADEQRWEVQLKGAGRTPYSRFADGRAVLRSSLREYLCSEAIHYLGIPTTRALCLAGTGEPVERDMFYDGHPRAEPGAIVTRVAPSFLRFGHYEILAARGEIDLLRQLVDYTITTHFPELGTPSPETYVAWFDTVCRRTALLVAHWLRVGFVHGVMNTDNLSVLGLTIDYGPYGWLDNFDVTFTPNTTDRGGRYSYGNQTRVASWNLHCLANALFPLIGDAKPLEASLAAYGEHFDAAYLGMLRDKLGLPADIGAADSTLMADLFDCFGDAEIDHTIFFRRLGRVTAAMPIEDALSELAESFYAAPAPLPRTKLADWLLRWQARVGGPGAEPDVQRKIRMDAVNPWLIPRNWLAQQAITAAEAGDMGVLERLMQALREPYVEQAGFADLAVRRPDWARSSPGCSALSCSS